MAELKVQIENLIGLLKEKTETFKCMIRNEEWTLMPVKDGDVYIFYTPDFRENKMKLEAFCIRMKGELVFADYHTLYSGIKGHTEQPLNTLNKVAVIMCENVKQLLINHIMKIPANPENHFSWDSEIRTAALKDSFSKEEFIREKINADKNLAKFNFIEMIVGGKSALELFNEIRESDNETIMTIAEDLAYFEEQMEGAVTDFEKRLFNSISSYNEKASLTIELVSGDLHFVTKIKNYTLQNIIIKKETIDYYELDLSREERYKAEENFFKKLSGADKSLCARTADLDMIQCITYRGKTIYKK